MNHVKRAVVTLAIIGSLLGVTASAFADTNQPLPSAASSPGSMCVRLTLWDLQKTVCAPLV